MPWFSQRLLCPGFSYLKTMPWVGSARVLMVPVPQLPSPPKFLNTMVPLLGSPHHRSSACNGRATTSAVASVTQKSEDFIPTCIAGSPVFVRISVLQPAMTEESRHWALQRRVSVAGAMAVPGARSSDSFACAAAFEREVAFVKQSLRRHGVGFDDADDLTHEVLIVMWRRWADYDPSRPLRPWLAGIVFKVAHRHRLRRRREIAH